MSDGTRQKAVSSDSTLDPIAFDIFDMPAELTGMSSYERIYRVMFLVSIELLEEFETNDGGIAYRASDF